MLRPPMAHSLFWSKAFEWWQRYQWSSNVLPGPVSKPNAVPVFGRTVMFAIPPMLIMARLTVGDRNIASWNAGVKGAPWPPTAMSPERKSAMVVMPVRAAIKAPLPSWSENGKSPAGRWRTVCPWLPITAMSCLRVAFSATWFAALANCSASAVSNAWTVSIQSSSPLLTVRILSCSVDSIGSVCVAITWALRPWSLISTNTASMASLLVPDMRPIQVCVSLLIDWLAISHCAASRGQVRWGAGYCTDFVDKVARRAVQSFAFFENALFSFLAMDEERGSFTVNGLRCWPLTRNS